MTVRIPYPYPMPFPMAVKISGNEVKTDGGDLRAWKEAARINALPYYFDSAKTGDAEMDVWVLDNIASAVLLPDFLHYWKLDADGDHTTDFGINGRTLTANSTLPNTTTGQVGGGQLFNGSSDYYNLTDANDVNQDFEGLGGISAEFWVKRTAISGSTEYMVFLVVGTGGAGWCQISFDVNDKLSFAIRTHSAGTIQTVITDDAIADTDLHHVAFTCDLATDALKIYVDGAVVPFTGGVTFTQSTFVLGGAHASWDANFGKNSFGASGYFNGVLDDVSTYGRALSAIEVQSIYLRGSEGRELSALKPTAHWSMDNLDNSGAELLDVAGGHNGIFTGEIEPVWIAGRVEGTAIKFDGTDDQIKILHSTDIAPYDGGGGTVSMFWTLRISSSSGQTRILWEKDNNNGANAGLIAYVSDEDRLGIAVRTPAPATGNYTKHSSVKLVPGVDYSVGVSYDQSVGGVERLQLWIDGVNVPFLDLSTGAPPTSITANTLDAYLCRWVNAGNILPFGGNVDEFGMLADVLTQSEWEDLAVESRRGNRADAVSWWDTKDVRIHMPFGLEYYGSVPLDTTGNGHNLATVDNLRLGADAQIGQAMSRPAWAATTSRFTQADGALRPDLQAFTVAFWVFIPAAAGGSGFLGHNTAFVNPYIRAYDPNDGALGGTSTHRIVWDIRSAGGTSITSLGWRAEDEGTWVFCCVAHSAAGASQTMYVGKTVDGAWSSQTDNTAFSTLNGAGWAIGNYSNGAFPMDPLVRMSDVQMYIGEQLSETAARELFQKGRAEARYTASPVSAVLSSNDPSALTTKSAAAVFGHGTIEAVVRMYHLDDDEGVTLVDETGADNGTVIGEATTKEGTFGKRLDLRGKSCVDFSGNSHVQSEILAYWFDIQTTATSGVIWANYDGNNNNKGSALEIAATGRIQVRHSRGTGGAGETVTGAAATIINDGAIHRIVILVGDGVAQFVYVDDNTQEDTDTLLGSIDTPQSVDRLGQYSFDPAMPPTNIKGDWDVSRPLEVTLVGDKISQIDVLAGGAMGNLTQAVDADRPIFAPGVMNGRDGALLAQGSTAKMTMTGLNAPSDDVIIMAVLKWKEDLVAGMSASGALLNSSSPVNRSRVTLGYDGFTANSVLYSFGSVDGAAIYYSGYTAGATLPTTDTFLFEHRVSGVGGVEWFINGVNVASNYAAGTGAMNPLAAHGFHLMDQLATFGGYLGRLAVWSKATGTGPGTNGIPLTDADISAARRTMMNQFGIEDASTYNENGMSVRSDFVMDEFYVTRHPAQGPFTTDIQAYMDHGFAFLVETNKMIARARVDNEPKMNRIL